MPAQGFSHRRVQKTIIALLVVGLCAERANANNCCSETKPLVGRCNRQKTEEACTDSGCQWSEEECPEFPDDFGCLSMTYYETGSNCATPVKVNNSFVGAALSWDAHFNGHDGVKGYGGCWNVLLEQDKYIVNFEILECTADHITFNTGCQYLCSGPCVVYSQEVRRGCNDVDHAYDIWVSWDCEGLSSQSQCKLETEKDADLLRNPDGSRPPCVQNALTCAEAEGLNLVSDCGGLNSTIEKLERCTETTNCCDSWGLLVQIWKSSYSQIAACGFGAHSECTNADSPAPRLAALGSAGLPLAIPALLLLLQRWL